MVSGMIVRSVSHAHIVKVNIRTPGTLVSYASNELGLYRALRAFAENTVVSDERRIGAPRLDVNSVITAREFS
jgi:hypothetical protein